jgi:hypothetical protein
MIDFLCDVVCSRNFWFGVVSGWLAIVLVVLASFVYFLSFVKHRLLDRDELHSDREWLD